MRTRKAARRFKTIARHILRQLESGVPEGDPDQHWLSIARRVLEQKKHDTHKSGVIMGAYSLPENDYDGHTVEPALQQVERLSGYRPQVAIADRGYRGRSRAGAIPLWPFPAFQTSSKEKTATPSASCLHPQLPT